jgi:uncharacterized protein (DUF2384 family)
MLAKNKALTNNARAVLGFASAKYLGLSEVEQASVFGKTNCRMHGLSALQRNLRRRMSGDDYARLKHLMDIAAAMKALYGKKTNIKKWVNEPNKDFDYKSPKELLTSGNLSDMERVANRLHALIKQQ